MKKFYLETFGCKFNRTDSKLIKDVLKGKFEQAPEDGANFVILNTCGVVEKTERKIIKRAIELKEKGKKVIFAGCLPLISPKICEKVADGILGPKNILDLPKAIDLILRGKKIKVIKNKSIDKAKLRCFSTPKKNCISIIPIAEGCLSNCSYCAAKLARGRLKSFDQREILENIKMALRSGAKEIQLTSQDLAVYGLEKGKFLLPDLLRKISEIEGKFKIRLGMMNPFFVKRILKELLLIMENEKFYKFLHLPSQSGSEKVLKSMNRKYQLKDFLEIVSKFREKFENSILATDVIVGFPTEDEKDFQKTVSMIKKIRPEILHLFRYSERPGTEASKMKDLMGKIKKERSRILTKVWLQICQKESKKYLGKTFDSLITEKKGNCFLARLNSYKAVILREGKIGDFFKVKIFDAKPNYLIGKICKR